MEETPSPTEPSTKAPESPEKPLLGELMVTGSSPDSLSLSWTIPQGHFDSFTVQYRDGDGKVSLKVCILLLIFHLNDPLMKVGC